VECAGFLLHDNKQRAIIRNAIADLAVFIRFLQRLRAGFFTFQNLPMDNSIDYPEASPTHNSMRSL
jgi:hypothetical protein